LAIKRKLQSQAWWCTPVIPALRRLRQEDHEFEVDLSIIVRPCLKKKTKKKKNRKKRKLRYMVQHW
jgi:hypothetical protein